MVNDTENINLTDIVHDNCGANATLSGHGDNWVINQPYTLPERYASDFGFDHEIEGTLRTEWEDIGEGLEGEWNPDDPEDIALLRFTVGFVPAGSQSEGEDYMQFDDGSYCTQMPAQDGNAHHIAANDEVQIRALCYIHSLAAETLPNGHFKRAMEEASWVGLDHIA